MISAKAMTIKTVKRCYSTLLAGISSTRITRLVNNAGYTSYGTTYQPTITTFKNALKSYEVVLAHSHGAQSYRIVGNAYYHARY